MKVRIEYKYEVNEPHCWAISEIAGEKLFSGGDTWAECRERHLVKLSEIENYLEAPLAEEVEIKAVV